MESKSISHHELNCIKENLAQGKEIVVMLTHNHFDHRG